MNVKKQIIDSIVACLEIPPSAYEKAYDRYNDLGEWFCKGSLKVNKPRVYAQGSFRLGTVIRPLHDHESYDLDVGCRLESGITKETHTQKDLKTLVRDELEAYRKARRIETALEEKHRCWCLAYADELKFTEDIVPSIPEEAKQRTSLVDTMVSSGWTPDFAQAVSRHAGSITDNRRTNYSSIDHDWLMSNSEGYALWFEARMEIASGFRERVASIAAQAKVEKLKTWQWKSPLQKAVQLLKRHRDSMFVSKPQSKPISIIITTLAGHAYQGEEDATSAVGRILSDMDYYLKPSAPRVPNPVNPKEDFADKWYRHDCADHKLEDNFKSWLDQARIDFQNIEKLVTEEAIQKFTLGKFALRIPEEGMAKIRALLPESDPYRNIQVITSKPAKPWRQ